MCENGHHSQERGNRVVHYFLNDSAGESILAVVVALKQVLNTCSMLSLKSLCVFMVPRIEFIVASNAGREESFQSHTMVFVVNENPTRHISTWPYLNGSFYILFEGSNFCDIMATIEAFASSSLCRVLSPWTVESRPRVVKPTASFVFTRRNYGLMISNRRLRTPSALGELADTVAETGKSEITWQIIVGTIAGVIPFVVAGVEFSKRIIAQKRCEECKGTGLVFRDKKYFRCPDCGGFLPWQSWRRFFTG